MNRLQIFSPATVANVSCGFDALGFAIASLGDTMLFTRNESGKVTISKIEGAILPYDTDENVAGAVAKLMLEKASADFGLEVEISKNFKPGSGLGSSAASAAGTAFAVNLFLDRRFSMKELVEFARYGEEVACGSPIADNVSAALYGGFVLIRSLAPLDVIKIPTPAELTVTILHPQIEIRTEEARKVVPETIPTKTAISQWANVGGLISGLYESDFERIGRSLVDLVAEPTRKKLIPHFDQVKVAAMEAGALGAGISGSGPAIFALCKGLEDAGRVADAMEQTYAGTGIEHTVYTSEISEHGVKILSAE